MTKRDEERLRNLVTYWRQRQRAFLKSLERFPDATAVERAEWAVLSKAYEDFALELEIQIQEMTYENQ